MRRTTARRATSLASGLVGVGSMLALLGSVALAQTAPVSPAAPDAPKQQDTPKAETPKAGDAKPATEASKDGTQGMVDMVNRLEGTIGIAKPSDGKDAGPALFEEYKIPKSMIDTVHAGDVVTYTVSENTSGMKTITKLDVPKPIPHDSNQ